ncbi:MAG: IS110 family transposase, partial [Gammaproteobacteria bacterium]
MKDIKTLGIDLAKNIFQLHGNDAAGRVVYRKRVRRSELAQTLAKLKPCLIGMEACGGAHHWARTFQAMGHTVKLISPQFVKPYVKSNKTDRNDAQAIAEAITRPGMRFVSVKTTEQQDILLIHRARERLIRARTSQANHIRGLLQEYGIVIPKGIHHIRKHLPDLCDMTHTALSEQAKEIFIEAFESLIHLDEHIKRHDQRLMIIAKQDERCKLLMEIDGVGALTASAAIATIGDPKSFKRGREVSAWLGLVPRQHSSGDKIRLGGISKRGDRYLRTLLIHGARSVVKVCSNKESQRHRWLSDKKERAGYNKAAVA